MAKSVVRAPKDENMDYDFIAFSFNGLHSYEDFGIYRTSDGDRYNVELGPTMQDKTAENPGGDGMYFFGTNHKQKNFNINFAFEHLTEEKLREMKKWLNGREMGDLWFAEEPYKVYSAKVTGQPSIKAIPFDDYDENGNKIRIYKGEGSVTFTAHWPYAHTPDEVAYWDDDIGGYTGQSPEKQFQANEWVTLQSPIYAKFLTIVQVDNGQSFNDPITVMDDSEQQYILKKIIWYGFSDGLAHTITKIKTNKDVRLSITYSANEAWQMEHLYWGEPGPGKLLDSYKCFSNLEQWIKASGIIDTYAFGTNPGDLPAPFILTHSGIDAGVSQTFKVGDLSITVGGTTSKQLKDIVWDSKTGMVSAKVDNSSIRTAIPYTGNSLGGIPVGGANNLVLNGGTLEYHYWYY